MHLTHTSLLAVAAPQRHRTVLAATAQEGPSGTVVVLTLCALAVVIAGAVVWLKHHRRATWFRAPAVVTDLVTRSIGGGNHDVFPKFTFVNAHREEVSLEQHSNRPRCQLGEQIDVLQNPKNPYQVVADRRSRR